VLDHLFQCLVSWLAPVLVFTAEEAWLTRFPSDEGSVHLHTFPEIPSAWRDPVLGTRWERVRRVRRVVTGALEIERREKRIGSSLEAAPRVFVTAEDARVLAGLDVAELAITSGIEVREAEPPDDAFVLEDVPGVGVIPMLAAGRKCARCWQVLPEVGEQASRDLCRRCTDAVAALAAA
jgi:isoleucyl-tRNA synthetase